jgi:hypothetical protein
MMRLSIGIVSGFLMSLTVWLLLAFGQMGNYTPSSQWVREAYQYKNDISDQISASKIAIIAGSNALFGLNSSMLSDYYQRPVINQGVNAGVGLAYIIGQGKRILKEGDIALLPIEYGMFNYDENANSVMLDYYLSDSKLFFQQSTYLQLNILQKLSMKRLYEGYLELPEGFKVSGLYGAHNMNGSGDQINSSISQRHASQMQVLRKQIPSRDGKYFSGSNKSWDILTSFQRYANENNICLIYIPATIMYDTGYSEIASEKSFFSGIPLLSRELGLTYIGNPFDFMYPTERYFDTNYHLTSEHRDLHTKNIIELLGDDLNQYCH